MGLLEQAALPGIRTMSRASEPSDALVTHSPRLRCLPPQLSGRASWPLGPICCAVLCPSSAVSNE